MNMSQQRQLKSLNRFDMDKENQSNPFPLSIQKQKQYENSQQKPINFSALNMSNINAKLQNNPILQSNQKQQQLQSKYNPLYSNQKPKTTFSQFFQSEQKKPISQFGGKRTFENSQQLIHSIKKQDRLNYKNGLNNQTLIKRTNSQQQENIDISIDELLNDLAQKKQTKENKSIRQSENVLNQNKEIDFSKNPYIPDIDDELQKKMDETLMKAFPTKLQSIDINQNLQNIQEEDDQQLENSQQLVVPNIFEDFKVDFQEDMFQQDEENQDNQENYFNNNNFCINTQAMNTYLNGQEEYEFQYSGNNSVNFEQNTGFFKTDSKQYSKQFFGKIQEEEDHNNSNNKSQQENGQRIISNMQIQNNNSNDYCQQGNLGQNNQQQILQSDIMNDKICDQQFEDLFKSME